MRKQELALVDFIFLPLAFLEPRPSGICRCSTTNEKCLCDVGPGTALWNNIYSVFCYIMNSSCLLAVSVVWGDIPGGHMNIQAIHLRSCHHKTLMLCWKGRHVFASLQVILTLNNLASLSEYLFIISPIFL